jgi:hypothetical protein
MASSGNNREALLDAGGVLSMIGGIVELIGGAVILVVVRHIMTGGPLRTVPHIPWMPGLEIQLVFFPIRVLIVGIIITVLGAIGIAGGMSALSRKSFGLSLAGAICVLPTVIFGIPAVVFVALSKREFSVEIKEHGIPSRRWLPIAGGILSIIGGVIDLVGMRVWYATLSYLGVPWVTSEPYLRAGWLAIILVFSFVMSLSGGLAAINRKSFGGSLAGAICALPSTIFGILAVIFIVLGKREFDGVRI